MCFLEGITPGGNEQTKVRKMRGKRGAFLALLKLCQMKKECVNVFGILIVKG